MGKKNQGHYCFACGRSRPNEKFSGKGHRQHLCKDCNKKGRKADQSSTSDYDRKLSYLSKAIRNCLILYTQKADFFLFEYQGARYITRDDFESEIFIYQPDTLQKFLVSESLQTYEPLMEVLYKKYYDTMESGLSLEYEDVIENEFLEISKKRKQHLEVILSINHWG